MVILVVLNARLVRVVQLWVWVRASLVLLVSMLLSAMLSPARIAPLVPFLLAMLQFARRVRLVLMQLPVLFPAHPVQLVQSWQGGRPLGRDRRGRRRTRPVRDRSPATDPRLVRRLPEASRGGDRPVTPGKPFGRGSRPRHYPDCHGNEPSGPCHLKHPTPSCTGRSTP